MTEHNHQFSILQNDAKEKILNEDFYLDCKIKIPFEKMSKIRSELILMKFLC